MSRRIAIVSGATAAGLIAAVLFSEITRSHSNAGAALFFGLGLGTPLLYAAASLATRRWTEMATAVGIAVVAWFLLVTCIMVSMGSGMSGMG